MNKKRKNAPVGSWGVDAREDTNVYLVEELLVDAPSLSHDSKQGLPRQSHGVTNLAQNRVGRRVPAKRTRATPTRQGEGTASRETTSEIRKKTTFRSDEREIQRSSESRMKIFDNEEPRELPTKKPREAP